MIAENVYYSILKIKFREIVSIYIIVITTIILFLIFQEI